MTLQPILPDVAPPAQPPIHFAAELYAATFAGRRDAYSVFAGEHWQAVRRPLTAETVIKAFTTGVPISGYFLGPDSATHLAALDIDRPDGYELGGRFLSHLKNLGGVGYLEASRRGAHVWIVLDERRPALMIRLALRALVMEAGLPNDPKIELRPGSDRLGEPIQGEEPPLGHCLRMPTMPHPTTGKRYVLVSSEGEKLEPRLVDFITLIDLCPVEILEDAAERAPRPEVEVTIPRSLRRPFGDPDTAGAAYSESMSTILRDLWGVMEPLHPGRGFRCPAHDDTNKSALLHRSDERWICYSPECWADNGGSGRGTIEATKNAPRRRS